MTNTYKRVSAALLSVLLLCMFTLVQALLPA